MAHEAWYPAREISPLREPRAPVRVIFGYRVGTEAIERDQLGAENEFRLTLGSGSSYSGPGAANFLIAPAIDGFSRSAQVARSRVRPMPR